MRSFMNMKSHWVSVYCDLEVIKQQLKLRSTAGNFIIIIIIIIIINL